MRLRDIDFGSVFVASGTLNFFGQGWPFHSLYKLLFPWRFDFTGATFTSKTTTWEERPGNLPLTGNLQPAELRPDCIRIYLLQAMVLNAVGLSGPGAQALLAANEWQQRLLPWVLSFMSVAQTKAQRLQELQAFVDLVCKRQPEFRAKFALQINISCPNTGHNTTQLVDEALELLTIANQLGVPVDLKVNALISHELIREIEGAQLCDVITCSNTIPWGTLSEQINWQKLFGSTTSPLAHLGGGGLSGRPILDVVCRWIAKARALGIRMPIKGGGGILCPQDAAKMISAGANAIEIGTIGIVRPWQVQPTISFAKRTLEP